MFDFSLISLLAGIPGLIIAMVIHEYAHARVAVALGDFTPKLMGRLTLNPRAHIDPVGLLMLFLIRFGWAKPVVINPNNFRQPRRDDILVSVAGPLANLLTAFVTLFLLVLFSQMGFHLSQGTILVCRLIITHPRAAARWRAYPPAASAAGTRLAVREPGTLQSAHHDRLHHDAHSAVCLRADAADDLACLCRHH